MYNSAHYVPPYYGSNHDSHYGDYVSYSLCYPFRQTSFKTISWPILHSTRKYVAMYICVSWKLLLSIVKYHKTLFAHSKSLKYEVSAGKKVVFSLSHILTKKSFFQAQNSSYKIFKISYFTLVDTKSEPETSKINVEMIHLKFKNMRLSLYYSSNPWKMEILCFEKWSINSFESSPYRTNWKKWNWKTQL